MDNTAARTGLSLFMEDLSAERQIALLGLRNSTECYTLFPLGKGFHSLGELDRGPCQHPGNPGSAQQPVPPARPPTLNQGEIQRQQGLHAAGLAMAAGAAQKLPVDAGRSVVLAQDDVQAAPLHHLSL